MAKVRSPNYPQLDLGAALVAVQRLTTRITEIRCRKRLLRSISAMKA